MSYPDDFSRHDPNSMICKFLIFIVGTAIAMFPMLIFGTGTLGTSIALLIGVVTVFVACVALPRMARNTEKEFYEKHKIQLPEYVPLNPINEKGD
jgi:hypothetical protein